MADLYLLTNKDIIDLYEIKLNDFEGYFRFHGSKNFDKNIVFGGYEYIFLPCEMSNLEYNSEGKQNRPTFVLSNTNNFITNLIKDRHDLLGNRLYRKKIFAKDLDSENFGGENKNTLGTRNTQFPFPISTDTFIINKKNSESKESVEFVLSNIVDIDGLTFPTRKVYNNFCHWQYRGAGCNYGSLSKYQGPVLANYSLAYTSLSQITTQFSLENNLEVWLKEDGRTFGEEITTLSQKGKTFSNKVLLSWDNSASEINTATPLPTTSIGGKPKQLLNDTIWNGSEGVYFNANYEDASGSTVYDSLQIIPKAGDASFDAGNYTIFYVSEMKNLFRDQLLGFQPASYTRSYKSCFLFFCRTKTKTIVPQFVTVDPYGGYARSIFTDSNLDLSLGYNGKDVVYQAEGGSTATFRVGNLNYFKYGGLAPKYNSEIRLSGTPGDLMFARNNQQNSTSLLPQIVSLAVREAESEQLERESALRVSSYNLLSSYSAALSNGSNNFWKNSNKLYEDSESFTHDYADFGINLVNDQASECAVYEVIIFNTLLTDEQQKAVHTYLAYKYSLPVEGSSLASQKIYINSDQVFANAGENFNLGVPVADENDKFFVLDDVSSNSHKAFLESYNLLTMQYRGDYNSQTAYKKGDFVKIDPEINFDFDEEYLYKNNEIPSRFFVCISELGSKDLHPLRFRNIWIEDKCSKKLDGCYLRFRDFGKLPFSGFPGTATYDYRLPGV